LSQRIIILGAGPAGLGAALRLRLENRARVTVIDQRNAVGGNAGSFEIAGQRVDYGSHRLHPACDPAILADIREMLGDELLERPRHGRIRLRGKWIRFPLRPLDLALHVDFGFAFGVGRDVLRRLLRPERGENDQEESFATVLRRRLGATITDSFYFPYARKIWGINPDELSAIQAKRRVSADSFRKLARKVLGQVPGMKPEGFRHFYYPKGGYGRISEAYGDAARQAGADLLLGHRAQKLSAPQGSEDPWRVTVSLDGAVREIEAEYVWSTIPITALARLISPPPPPSVVAAAERIDYRAMLLVYVTIAGDRYTEYDAHYFPGPETVITRLSEPKNYADSPEPSGRTTICAEIPCSAEDEIWKGTDDDLGERVVRDLSEAGIPPTGAVVGTHVRRLRHAYPIYRRGYEDPFEVLDSWTGTVPRSLTYGRQGLFAHDNTHHALYMAYSAASCFSEAGFDDAKWRSYRRVFETHVVED
jgi:protoporphyrinogen oxidase